MEPKITGSTLELAKKAKHNLNQEFFDLVKAGKLVIGVAPLGDETFGVTLRLFLDKLSSKELDHFKSITERDGVPVTSNDMGPFGPRAE